MLDGKLDHERDRLLQHRLQPHALALAFSKSEKRLIAALYALRSKLRELIKGEQGRRKVAGTFALEVLSKRLLSGPATFANSWQRIKLGLQESAIASDSELAAAQKRSSVRGSANSPRKSLRKSLISTRPSQAWGWISLHPTIRP